VGLPKNSLNKYRVYEVSCIVFLLASMMYMILPHLDIFNFPNFWTNFYYIKDYLYLTIILGLIHTFLVTDFQKMLSYSLMIFTVERLIFNILVAFLTPEDQAMYRNSGPIAIILSIELFVPIYLLRNQIKSLFKKIFKRHDTI